VVDVFADQPFTRGESTIAGTEVGLRYQLTLSVLRDDRAVVWVLSEARKLDRGASRSEPSQGLVKVKRAVDGSGG